VSVFKTPLTLPVVLTVLSGQTTSGQNVVIKPTGTFYAFSIQVAFQASDSFLPSSTSDPGDGQGSSSSSGGLDKGTAIGIGVGVGVAVILILSGAFLLWRRRKHNRGHLKIHGYTGVTSSRTSPGLSGSPAVAVGSGGGSTSSPSSLTYVAGGMPQVKIPETPQEVPGVPIETIGSEPVELPPDNLIAPTQEQRTPIAEIMGDSLPPGSTYLR
jgi:hypothetical protein